MGDRPPPVHGRALIAVAAAAAILTFATPASAQRDAASSGMYRIPASGAGREELLTESALAQIPGSFSNDGNQLVYRQGTGGANRNVYLLSLEGESESRPLLENAFFETHPALSPDGNLLVYTSYETGRPEVYIRPFPNTDSAVQRVSNNSGEPPNQYWGRVAR